MGVQVISPPEADWVTNCNEIPKTCMQMLGWSLFTDKKRMDWHIKTSTSRNIWKRSIYTNNKLDRNKINVQSTTILLYSSIRWKPHPSFGKANLLQDWSLCLASLLQENVNIY